MAEVTPDELYIAIEEFLVRLVGMGESESMDTLLAMDLSFSQVRTLFLLLQLGEPVAINEVAERLGLSVAAAGRSIDHLVCQKLVLRREDPVDRRIKRVSLSEAGRSLASRHVEDKRDELRAFAGRLPEGDRSRLFDAIQPILAGDALRARSQEFCR
ncbi:MarR family transcriptional regulator [Rhodococcus sp. ABRD24]|uniref:MarR family winged helix-turn-helix transcriptional regulator n=1 Tax=Rhodococcus sp. ABRD24 TaxID=2507582 RepID=UPI00103B149C|nr:MarR family transcriptional regulator [Rhodococcus sp. ABRD24]QBJ95647.1 MarR family transcriptional regulator [Rhodococcus sp. ABRD24]